MPVFYHYGPVISTLAFAVPLDGFPASSYYPLKPRITFCGGIIPYTTHPRYPTRRSIVSPLDRFTGSGRLDSNWHRAEDSIERVLLERLLQDETYPALEDHITESAASTVASLSLFLSRIPDHVWYDLEKKADAHMNPFRRALFIMNIAEIMRSERIEASIIGERMRAETVKSSAVEEGHEYRITTPERTEIIKNSLSTSDFLQCFCQTQAEQALFSVVATSAYAIAKQLRDLHILLRSADEDEGFQSYIHDRAVELILHARRVRRELSKRSHDVFRNTDGTTEDTFDIAHYYLDLAERYNPEVL